MRYTAEVLQDENDDTGYFAAVVAPAGPSERLAARHARAMAAVLRASKAEQRAARAFARLEPTAYEAYAAADMRWSFAKQRYRAAVARLEKVEKEVGRG